LLDQEDATEKGLTVDKVKAQRAKLLTRNKKMLSINTMCQLSDEMTSEDDIEEEKIDVKQTKEQK
jgi:hypothetical protein